jgi:hypothetical protein
MKHLNEGEINYQVIYIVLTFSGEKKEGNFEYIEIF